MAGKGVNKVILIGNLGQDPELKYTGSGTAFCNLSVATSDSYKDANGNLVDNTQWHKVVVWARLAEICNEYLKKGSKVYLEGSLQTRSYDDKDGNKKYITEVKAREMVMLDSRGGGGGGYQSNNGGGSTSNVKVSTGAPAPTSADDDLPF